MDDLKDRRVLKAALNDVAKKYGSVKLEMDKLSTSTPESKGKLRQMALDKAESLISQSDDLNRLNQGQAIKIAGASPAPLDPNEIIAKIKSGPENKINTKPMMKEISGGEFFDKIAGLVNKGGKKALSVLPLAGAGMAALSGDPAMAAEELAEDIPVAGQVYSAIKPTESGNVEEEKLMLAEDKARKDYADSPAAKNKMRRNALMGIK